MKQRVLELLSKQQGFLSGQQMCEMLGVSRTAIWKAIQQLKKQGYEIESISNKGYRLIENFDLLNQSELNLKLQTKVLGKELVFFSSIDSTNLEIARRAQEKDHGFLVVADEQTSGRGRRGRTWVSVEKKNLYFSLMLKPEFSPEVASMLTLVMALSVVQGIEQKTSLDCGIKWPNDIVCKDKKVCGILTEMRAEPDLIHYVTIGVGINVNQEVFLEESLMHASSLKLCGDQSIHRAELLASILNCFELNYELFEKEQNLASLVEEYNQKLINKEKDVAVLSNQEDRIGCCQGINSLGELIVEFQEGRLEVIRAGEVSVRGLYGYV